MSKTLAKVIIAGAAGFVAGILVAPKSGKETRADIVAKAEETKEFATEKAAQVAQAAKEGAASVKKGAKCAEREARGRANSA